MSLSVMRPVTRPVPSRMTYGRTDPCPCRARIGPSVRHPRRQDRSLPMPGEGVLDEGVLAVSREVVLTADRRPWCEEVAVDAEQIRQGRDVIEGEKSDGAHPLMLLVAADGVGEACAEAAPEGSGAGGGDHGKVAEEPP